MRKPGLTLHPAWFQGRTQRPPYFEGWYYKLVDATEQHRLAVIPGLIRNPAGGEPSHAFVQVLEGASGHASYHEYPLEAFEAAPDAFDVRIGPNRFRLDRLDLDIDDARGRLRGSVRMAGGVPWPVSIASPGAMGWFAWAPAMQCYHGVLSLDHALEGSLAVGEDAIDWQGGRGYIEKDWGRAFPSAWVWLQSNHFATRGTSLMVSVATVPWVGARMTGVIAGLWHNARLHRLATYTGARLHVLTDDGQQLRLVIRDLRLQLEIVAQRGPARGVLRGPSGVDMGVRVPEGLLGTLDVTLWRRGARAEQLFDGRGRNAGIEAVGDLQHRAKERP